MTIDNPIERKDEILAWRSDPLIFEVEKGITVRYASLFETEPQAAFRASVTTMPTILGYFNPAHWNIQRPIAFSASAGDEYTFIEPVRPGDTITVIQRYIDLFKKEGRSRPLYFVRDERTYTNQHGRLVARSHWTGLLKADLVGVGKVRREMPLVPPPRFAAYLDGAGALDRAGAMGHRPATAAPSPSAPPRYEGVEPGLRLPSLSVTMTYDLFIRFAAYNHEFHPHHVDYLYAVAGGWRDCIAQGTLGMGYLAALLIRWNGGDGDSLRGIKVRYRQPSYPGDKWRCEARVTGKRTKDGEELVDCEIWVETDEGVLTSGTATLALSTSR